MQEKFKLYMNCLCYDLFVFDFDSVRDECQQLGLVTIKPIEVVLV